MQAGPPRYPCGLWASNWIGSFLVFSSITFLCVFLPLTFLLTAFAHARGWSNGMLMAASLLFYAYGEPVYVLLLVASAICNYLFGLFVAPERDGRRRWLAVAVTANLALLGFYKYAGFAVQSANTLMGTTLPVPSIALPLGISFYTFQALSYVIDVYRGEVDPQRRFTRVLLYLSLFPQLVAGPIVKYRDVEQQLEHREMTAAGCERGLRRFSCGLAKKVLIADTMSRVVDNLYAQAPTLSAPCVWVAAFAYLLQIYYDFSGYSDMAIGLGHLFGFSFQENFDHPYVSASIKEFWRRWHMSLSTWFRDYLYIPLGGNRKGRLRTGLNKCAVFLLCGLWHGASWTFVLWGCIHGAFSLLEEVLPVKRLPHPAGRAYTMLVVTVAFVVFRAQSVSQAATLVWTMLAGWGMGDAGATLLLARQLTPLVLCTGLAGLVLAHPVADRLGVMLRERLSAPATQVACNVGSLALLVLSMVAISGGTYHPFIYFRF